MDTASPTNAKPVGFENASDCCYFKLAFTDEFDTNKLNLSKWTINVSDKSRAARPGLGISYWRWKEENVSVGGGNLQLAVKKVGYNAMTNGGIFSYQKYMKKYGYFEAIMKTLRI